LQAICFWPRFIIFHFEPSRPNRSDKHIGESAQWKAKGRIIRVAKMRTFFADFWLPKLRTLEDWSWSWDPLLYLGAYPKKSIHICITLPLSFVERCRHTSCSFYPPKCSCAYSAVSFFAAHLPKCLCAGGCVCICGRWRWNSWKLICQFLWQPFRRQSQRRKSINRRQSRRSKGVYQGKSSKTNKTKSAERQTLWITICFAPLLWMVLHF